MSIAQSCEQTRSRWKLAIFLGLVAAFSAIIAILQMSIPSVTAPHFITWLPFIADAAKMWSVGLAGLIALLTVDHSLRDIGLRFCRPRYFMIAAALPLTYCLAIYVPVWAFGIGGFRGEVYFLTRLLLAPLHLPLSLMLAAGEEIGWRGVLVPNLARTSSFATTAISAGAIWAVWHYPDILLFGYNAGTSAVYTLSCFSISLIGLGVFLSWLRLASNSVWPAILFHGVHNTLIFGVFDRATENATFTVYITTEFGAGMTAAATVVGYVCWANRSAVEHAGGLPLQSTARADRAERRLMDDRRKVDS